MDINLTTHIHLTFWKLFLQWAEVKNLVLDLSIKRFPCTRNLFQFQVERLLSLSNNVSPGTRHLQLILPTSVRCSSNSLYFCTSSSFSLSNLDSSARSGDMLGPKRILYCSNSSVKTATLWDISTCWSIACCTSSSYDEIVCCIAVIWCWACLHQRKAATTLTINEQNTSAARQGSPSVAVMNPPREDKSIAAVYSRY